MRWYVVRQCPAGPDDDPDSEDYRPTFWLLSTYRGQFDGISKAWSAPSNAPESTSLLPGDAQFLTMGNQLASYMEDRERRDLRWARDFEQQNAREQNRRDAFNASLNMLLREWDESTQKEEVIRVLTEHGFRPPARQVTVTAEVNGHTALAADYLVGQFNLRGDSGIPADVGTRNSGTIYMEWSVTEQFEAEYDGTFTCPCSDWAWTERAVRDQFDERGMTNIGSVNLAGVSCSLHELPEMTFTEVAEAAVAVANEEWEDELLATPTPEPALCDCWFCRERRSGNSCCEQICAGPGSQQGPVAVDEVTENVEAERDRPRDSRGRFVRVSDPVPGLQPTGWVTTDVTF